MKSWLIRAIALLLLCISLLIPWPAAVSAAESLPAPPTLQGVSLPRPELDPDAIPSEKVNQFVQSCVQVVALVERREAELQAAETDADSLRIQQEIEAEALAIIQASGLTRQEYIQLLGLANTDAEFGERVAILIQEAAK